MANAKVTALPEGTAIAATDLLYVVVDPGTTPVSKKATVANVLAASGTIAYTNITASGLITAGNFTTAGTSYVGGAFTAAGSIINTGGTIATTQVTASGLVSAGNFSTAGTLGAGTITSSGLLTAGNIHTGGTIGAGAITGSGLLTAANITTAGTIGAGAITSSALLTGANITTAGTIGAGAITSSALLTAANITTAGTIGAGAITSSALLTGANIHTAGTIGAGAITSSALLTGANIHTAGTIGSGAITSSALITGANIHTAGTIGSGAHTASSLNAGGAVNYTGIDGGGHLKMFGTATVFLDELYPLIGQKLESPSSDIVTNLAEGALEFKTSATLADYVVMPVQINHDWKVASNIYPHLHWWQTSTVVPNWLILHRWEVQGSAKMEAWSTQAWTSHAFAYSGGTFNQITVFGTITPPGNSGLSDILQIRLLRDTANASAAFGTIDELAASVYAVSLDVHKEKDTLGSNQEYSK